MTTNTTATATATANYDNGRDDDRDGDHNDGDVRAHNTWHTRGVSRVRARRGTLAGACEHRPWWLGRAAAAILAYSALVLCAVCRCVSFRRVVVVIK